MFMISSVMILFVIVVVTVFIDISIAHLPTVTSDLPEGFNVVFVSVVFRHGDRAPLTLYPGSLTELTDVTPPGLGELTPRGKERARQLGIALRRRYNDLLGENYIPNYVMARSTNVTRSKISLSKVLSGLYPGEQSIRVEITPIRKDNMMLSIVNSKQYIEELNKVKQSDDVKPMMKDFQPLINDIFNRSGHRYKIENGITNLYHQMTAESLLGLEIPQWAQDQSIWQRLQNAATRVYEIANFNAKLRKLNGGILLRNITETMTGIAERTINDGRKIQLFSGHEINIAALLSIIGVYDPHVPAYTSCVMVELLQDQNDEYYVRVLYYLGIPADTKIFQIPGCSNPCPLQTFTRLMQNVYSK